MLYIVPDLPARMFKVFISLGQLDRRAEFMNTITSKGPRYVGLFGYRGLCFWGCIGLSSDFLYVPVLGRAPDLWSAFARPAPGLRRTCDGPAPDLRRTCDET